MRTSAFGHLRITSRSTTLNSSSCSKFVFHQNSIHRECCTCCLLKCVGLHHQAQSHDPLEFVRKQAIIQIFRLLRDKPEQEQNLLRLLVNKLVSGIASTASG